MYTPNDRDGTLALNGVSKLYQMPTFAELLTEYAARTGIGDAELARRIQVSRLTLVRWKEGVTERPRYREDVLRCAEILRLTDEERDVLLVAAGFAPESVPPVAEPPAPLETEDAPPEVAQEAQPPRRRRRWVIRLGIPAIVLVIAIVGGLAALNLMDTTTYPELADGESLIALAPFVNYTAGQQGYNIRGRLKDAIDSEIHEAGLTGVRTMDWPEEIEDEEAAEAAGLRSAATVVIWGEYDSGRVIARFTIPRSGEEMREDQVVDIVSSPVGLPVTINADLTAEVRHVALITLGQLYLEQAEFDLAKTVLIQASTRPPADPEALANLRFLMGRAYRGGELADFDEAIWLFTQTLSIRPNSAEAYINRGLSYLDRGRPGDPELAIADLNRALAIDFENADAYRGRADAYLARNAPGDGRRAILDLDEALQLEPRSARAYAARAGAYLARDAENDLENAFADIEEATAIDPNLSIIYLNLGLAYLVRDSADDIGSAITEFSRAIGLAPDSPDAYFHRGLVRSAMEDMAASLDDLRRAQSLSPHNVEYNSALCRQLAVTGASEEALPYCDRAVNGDPLGSSRDSRGLALAVAEQYIDAAADFEAFLSWVGISQKLECAERYLSSRTAWIERLRMEENPFTDEALHELRPRPIIPLAGFC